MKKLISLLLSIILIFALTAPIASVAVAAEATPIVYIRGNGEAIYNADGEEVIAIYKKFFDALKIAGCETCSVEARTDDFKADIADALAILKTLI